VYSHNPSVSKSPRLGPNDALAELLARDGELDKILSGRGLTFYRPVELGPPPKPPQPLIIPAPDWDEKARQRKAAERELERQERERFSAWSIPNW
jgi:hypothetical protein